MSGADTAKTFIAILVVALVAAVDVARGQSWGEAQRLSTDAAVSEPLFLYDDIGRSAVAWSAVRAGVVPVDGRIARRLRRSDTFLQASESERPLGALSDAGAFGMENLLTIERSNCVRCAPRRAKLYARLGGFDGEFTRRRRLRTTGRVELPSLSVGGLGEAVVAWPEIARGKTRYRIWASLRHRRRFTRPRPLSRPGATQVATAMSISRGDAIVAWARQGRIEARIRRAGRGWGPVLRLGSVIEPRGISVAIGARRRAVVAWRSLEPRCRGDSCGPGEGNPVEVKAAWASARLRSFDGEVVLQRYEDLAGEGLAGNVATAFDQDGRAYVGWSGVDAQRRYRVHAATVFRSTVQSDEVLSSPDESSALSALRAGYPSAGGPLAGVIWVGASTRHVFAALRPGGGTAFDAAEQVTREPLGENAFPSAAQLEFDPISGRPTVVWRGPGGAQRNAIFASVRR